MGYIAYDWGCFVDEPFMNVNQIFPTQQKDVSLLVKAAEADMNVRRVIIFGSSVTFACNPWSDIDVYYEMDKNQNYPYAKVENPLDVWTNFSVNFTLRHEILNKGVVVYERDATRHT